MRENLRVGVLLGLVGATLYSAYAGVLFLLNGPGTFERNGATLQTVVLTYYAAGTLGGLTVGALWPLARSLPGTILIGVCVALIFFFCVSVAVDGPVWRWPAEVWQDVLLSGLFFGVAGSFIWRNVINR